MEKNLDIQTLEGVRKRFVVRLADSDGAAVDATLYTFGGGAECEGCESVDMVVVEVNAEAVVLALPPLTPGRQKGWTGEREPWHYQLRATEKATGGVFVVLSGSATVTEWRGATAADGAATMLETVQADVAVDGEDVQVAVTLGNSLPALPGPQGEQGPQGEKGEPFTYEDLTEEQKAELIAPLGYEEVEVAPEGGTEENYNAYGFGFVMPRGGRVTGLDLECRDSGTAVPADTPVWLKVWRGTELIARSAQGQQHAVDAVLRYTFAEPFKVAEGEEIKVSFHAEEGMAETGYYMGRQCCLRVVDKDPAEPGGLLGAAGGYGSESDATQRSWQAKHTWHMLEGVFAPAEHVADTTVHITAEEHVGLAELLARKDELLALLNS